MALTGALAGAAQGVMPQPSTATVAAGPRRLPVASGLPASYGRAGAGRLFGLGVLGWAFGFSLVPTNGEHGGSFVDPRTEVVFSFTESQPGVTLAYPDNPGTEEWDPRRYDARPVEVPPGVLLTEDGQDIRVLYIADGYFEGTKTRGWPWTQRKEEWVESPEPLVVGYGIASPEGLLRIPAYEPPERSLFAEGLHAGAPLLLGPAASLVVDALGPKVAFIDWGQVADDREKYNPDLASYPVPFDEVVPGLRPEGTELAEWLQREGMSVTEHPLEGIPEGFTPTDPAMAELMIFLHSVGDEEPDLDEDAAEMARVIASKVAALSGREREAAAEHIQAFLSGLDVEPRSYEAIAEHLVMAGPYVVAPSGDVLGMDQTVAHQRLVRTLLQAGEGGLKRIDDLGMDYDELTELQAEVPNLFIARGSFWGLRGMQPVGRTNRSPASHVSKLPEDEVRRTGRHYVDIYGNVYTPDGNPVQDVTQEEKAAYTVFFGLRPGRGMSAASLGYRQPAKRFAKMMNKHGFVGVTERVGRYLEDPTPGPAEYDSLEPPYPHFSDVPREEIKVVGPYGIVGDYVGLLSKDKSIPTQNGWVKVATGNGALPLNMRYVVRQLVAAEELGIKLALEELDVSHNTIARMQNRLPGLVTGVAYQGNVTTGRDEYALAPAPLSYDQLVHSPPTLLPEGSSVRPVGDGYLVIQDGLNKGAVYNGKTRRRVPMSPQARVVVAGLLEEGEWQPFSQAGITRHFLLSKAGHPLGPIVEIGNALGMRLQPSEEELKARYQRAPAAPPFPLPENWWVVGDSAVVSPDGIPYVNGEKYPMTPGDHDLFESLLITGELMRSSDLGLTMDQASAFRGRHPLLVRVDAGQGTEILPPPSRQWTRLGNTAIQIGDEGHVRKDDGSAIDVPRTIRLALRALVRGKPDPVKILPGTADRIRRLLGPGSVVPVRGQGYRLP